MNFDEFIFDVNKALIYRNITTRHIVSDRFDVTKIKSEITCRSDNMFKSPYKQT